MPRPFFEAKFSKAVSAESVLRNRVPIRTQAQLIALETPVELYRMLVHVSEKLSLVTSDSLTPDQQIYLHPEILNRVIRYYTDYDNSVFPPTYYTMGQFGRELTGFNLGYAFDNRAAKRIIQKAIIEADALADMEYRVGYVNENVVPIRQPWSALHKEATIAGHHTEQYVDSIRRIKHAQYQEGGPIRAHVRASLQVGLISDLEKQYPVSLTERKAVQHERETVIDPMKQVILESLLQGSLSIEKMGNLLFDKFRGTVNKHEGEEGRSYKNLARRNIVVAIRELRAQGLIIGNLETIALSLDTGREAWESTLGERAIGYTLFAYETTCVPESARRGEEIFDITRVHLYHAPSLGVLADAVTRDGFAYAQDVGNLQPLIEAGAPTITKESNGIYQKIQTTFVLVNLAACVVTETGGVLQIRKRNTRVAIPADKIASLKAKALS